MTNFKIIVVDDDQSIREIIVETLEALENESVSFSIVEAEDGAAALRKISVQKFDLVITDFKMPKLNGQKLIDQIKENVDKEYHPNGFLVVTGYATEEDFDEDVSVLLKPFDTQELISLVKKQLARKKKKAVKKKAKPKSNKINVEFVNTFIDSTLEVLDVMCGTEAEKDFVFVREEDDSFGDISGVIPIQSNEYVGSMAITFPENVYLGLVSKMLGEEYLELNEENRDGVAEICNQIFGNAKAGLTSQGYSLDKTIPSIITGNNHVVSHAVSVSQILAVYFKTQLGSFVVECVLTAK